MLHRRHNARKPLKEKKKHIHKKLYIDFYLFLSRYGEHKSIVTSNEARETVKAEAMLGSK